MSSTLSTPTPAVLSSGLMAVTTPFIQPPGCSTARQYTRITTTKPDSNEIQTLDVLISDPGLAGFTSCQPSITSNTAVADFSPAVCPASWTAYGLTALTHTISGTTRTISSAICCGPHEDLYISGVQALSMGYFTSNPACVGTITSENGITLTGTNKASMTDVSITAGLTVQPAWQISWEASDVPTLSPRPPDLASGVSVATWVPGGPVTSSCSQESCGKSGASGQTYNGLVVGLAVTFSVIGAIVLGWLTFCFVRRKRDKTRRATS